ncbi:MAG: hypothetical protein HY057_08280 [Rhodospirillales bacterium]|nr:hypothetical protein [Rhodospirillales bacterium]
MHRRTEESFVARRAAWLRTANITMAAGLVLIALLNLYQLVEDDGPLMTGFLFAVLAALYAWQATVQFFDQQPQMIVAADGLILPTATPEPIVWSDIHEVRISSGLFGMGTSRIDFTVAPETRARIKLGQRFMGDFVIRRPGVPNGFSLATPGLDRNVAEIYKSLREFWPPPETNAPRNDED